MARLALLISGMGPGGAERVMSILSSGWAERGDEVILLTLEPPGTPPFHPLHPAVDHRPLGLARVSRNPVDAVLANLSRLRRLRRAIRATRADAVLSFGTEMNVLVLIASLGLGIPVVVSERNDPRLYPTSRFWRFARRLVYPLADAIAAQTRAAAAALGGGDRVAVIPNPVPPPPPFEPRPIGTSSQAIAVGRLVPDKGFDILLEAFARVARDRPNWSLTILGEGPDRAMLERRAGMPDLAGRVRLPGVTTDVAAAMRGADLFVLSSRSEGFPNVLCEALALGMPVIAAECGGSPAELIENGVDGLLVPSEDVAGLADAIRRLTGDAAERGRLAAAAPAAVADLDPARILARWDALLLRRGER